VDHLVSRGLRCVTVLDVSAPALARARARRGEQAGHVRWIEADVTGPWTVAPVDIWHDRAVFHFLTEAEDRARYVTRVQDEVARGGTVIIGTFAPDGPARCSGLPVCRHDAAGIGAELGEGFTLVETVAEERPRLLGALGTADVKPSRLRNPSTSTCCPCLRKEPWRTWRPHRDSNPGFGLERAAS
jgi:hypothetical protein